MSQEKSEYRQIFKATSIFGGVQVFNILVSVLRSKVIAVLLGPAGMGISGMLLSAITLITSITSFGLNISSIKNIATAAKSEDKQSLLRTTAILHNLVWYTGSFGVILTLVLSPLLSKITFNNYQYTWSFVMLSITLLLGQITLGKDAVLQGTRQLKWLASASMISSAASLIVTLPLYYYWGVKGIVPAMIVMSLVTLIITQIFYRKLRFIIPKVTYLETWKEGKSMLKLGFYLSLSSLILTGCAYIVRIFITRFGTLDDVGFYNAGFAVINSYVGIVLSAMATDYYPRLVGLVNDKSKYIDTVNQQGNVAILILGPIISIFITACNFIITLLYSKDFLSISGMMQYAIIGIFFRAASWLLGFIVLAKGATKVFFICELSANIYMTVLNCIFFYYWKLEGLGVSFIIGYVIYFIQMMIVTNTRYEFKFSNQFIRIFVVQLTIAIAGLLVIKFSTNLIYKYILGSLLVFLSFFISIVKMNKIIDLTQIIKKLRNK